MNTLPKRGTFKNSKNLCPVCHSKNLTTFFQLHGLPVSCNTLWSTKKKARNSPKGDIRLGFCSACSYIMNLDFEPTRLKYTQAYGNPLHFSPYFKNYAKSLSERLVKKYNLNKKDIIEIGCGDGYFLQLICKLGNNRGVGFDPAHGKPKHADSLNGQVKFIKDYYSKRYSNHQGDFIVCRQTLEHIPNPIDFLKMLKQTIGNHKDKRLFFEVPNATQIFRSLFIWDIIYEHCSYFTSPALARTFSASGFQVDKLSEEFEGQFLCVHARPGDQRAHPSYYEDLNEIDEIAKDIESFASNYQNKIQTIRQKMEQAQNKGQRAVVWGAGSKGVSLLNVLRNTQIEYVVDINPKKQDLYIPGTAQQIVSSEFLSEYQPDIIIVMNPIYGSEIHQLTKKLGLTAKFISV